MHEYKNDEEEADFLTDMIDERPFKQSAMDVLKNEGVQLANTHNEEVRKTIPPELEKTLEIFKKFLKSQEV